MDQDEKMGEIKNLGKEKKKIKTSTGLIAIFAAVVLFFGGALTYWTYNDPNSYSTSTDSTVVSTKVVEDAATADWASYTNTNYGFSFKYPKEWESTKVETTSDTAQGEYGTDIVFKVSFYDPANKKLIDCANNEFQSWSDKSPTKTECDPILSTLTKAEKDKVVGPRMPKNIYVRVYKDNPSLALKDWLYQKFHKPDTNLSDYQVGKEIELGGIKGYQSSIGCCAGVDNNYVVKANGYILSFGTNYFENNITDTELPAIFTQIAATFKVTDLTADWKTYTNDTYGFSFKYPSTWKATDYSSKSTGLFSQTDVVKDASGAIQPNIIIGYSGSLADFVHNEFGSSASFSSLLEALQSSTSYLKSQDINTHKITIDGETGYWALVKDAVTVFIQKNDSVYFVTYATENKDYNSISAEQKSILSSFQFTK